MTTSSVAKHTGGCHCGAVRFEVTLDLAAGGSMCNCTVCVKISAVGAIVKPDAFTLLSRDDSLSSYEWGGKVERRRFCKHCGVHCFARGYLEVLGGDFVAVNLNCLDDFDRSAMTIGHWDGRHNNWEAGQRPTPWPITA